MGGSEFCTNNMKSYWWCHSMGGYFFEHFGPLSTNCASFKLHSHPEYCCSCLCDHNVPIFKSPPRGITWPDTKLKSSQTGLLEITMSSLHLNCLHSRQISLPKSTFGTLWNGKFALWMCCQQSAWCYRQQNLWGIFTALCWINAAQGAKVGPTQ